MMKHRMNLMDPRMLAAIEGSMQYKNLVLHEALLDLRYNILEELAPWKRRLYLGLEKVLNKWYSVQ